jgi:hypothetical protein
MSLLPSVICDCVGLDRYTTAFGILFLFRGVTSIIGPPAAGLNFKEIFLIILLFIYFLCQIGFLKDYTKKYDLAFAIGGAMIIIAAFFHFALSYVQPERNEEKEEIDV